MYIPEKGVLPNSNTYFNTPGSMAYEMFYYLRCVGHFYCNGNYHVKRNSYNSYLLIYIKNGLGYVDYNGKKYSAKANDIILLDCYKPHEYFTREGWEILWMHFDGNCSRQFVELINSRLGYVISTSNTILVKRLLTSIIEEMKTSGQSSEALISAYIHMILSDLMMLSSELGMEKRISGKFTPVAEPGYNVQPAGNKNESINQIADVINYIQNNYGRKLTIAGLASSVSLSSFYFSRLFKKETGYSPYEFIIKTRIDNSKILLKKTDLSIKEIAINAGFSSVSNFIYTFRNHVGMSPKQFRNMQF
ncbi:MAG TPA: AraC family transcriptional regulator [Clostridiaceae bacterium]|nr:AraC family transcriptional regulator [Clostridiaceae bacterium]